MQESNYNGFEKWLALFVVIIGTFMAILDSSIVNIAVPKMMSVFGVSLESIQWILTAYTLTLGAVIPLTGYLMDNFGCKRVYIFALGFFTMGSLLCGLAWSNSSMIIFRVIQALGGGMIMPVGMALVYQVFPMEERGMALGFWGIAAMAAPAIGPTLGGFIIEKMDWKLIYTVNVPIGIVGVMLALIVLKSTPIQKLKPFDYIGFITCALGIVSILYVLGEGSSIDWSEIKNPMLLTLGCLTLVMFVINELTHPYPLLDLRVLKNLNYTISIIISNILTLALMGGAYIVPLFLQSIRGYTAMQTGIIMFPSAIATGFMMPISGKVADKVGAKIIIIPGLILLFFASYRLTFMDMDISSSSINLILVLRGIGLGLTMMVIGNVGMNSIERNEISKASALQNTIKQIASALAVTVMTTLVQSKLNYNYARYVEQINSFNATATGTIRQLQGLFLQGGQSSVEAQGSAMSTLQGLIYKQTDIEAMQHALMFTAAAVLVAIAFAFLMQTKPIVKNNKEENVEVIDGALE